MVESLLGHVHKKIIKISVQKNFGVMAIEDGKVIKKNNKNQLVKHVAKVPSPKAAIP